MHVSKNIIGRTRRALETHWSKSLGRNIGDICSSLEGRRPSQTRKCRSGIRSLDPDLAGALVLLLLYDCGRRDPSVYRLEASSSADGRRGPFDAFCPACDLPRNEDKENPLPPLLADVCKLWLGPRGS